MLCDRSQRITDDGERSDKLILPHGDAPPVARPVAAGLILRFGSGVEVEARDAGFDVDELVHG